MTSSRRLLCGGYGLVALLALVATWNQNLQFMAPPGANAGPGSGLAQFWLATLANHATTSITVDLFLLLFVAVIWMVMEWS